MFSQKYSFLLKSIENTKQFSFYKKRSFVLFDGFKQLFLIYFSLNLVCFYLCLDFSFYINLGLSAATGDIIFIPK